MLYTKPRFAIAIIKFCIFGRNRKKSRRKREQEKEKNKKVKKVKKKEKKRENVKPQTQDQKQIGSYRQTTKTKEQMLFNVTLFTLKGAASPKRRTLEQD